MVMNLMSGVYLSEDLDFGGFRSDSWSWAI